MGAIQQVLLSLAGMTKFTKVVAASTDDCVETIGVSLSLDTANVMLGKASTYAYNSGVRFLNVTIPNGATIIQAYLSLRAGGNNADATCKVKIFGEDADDAATYSTLADFNARTPTTAYSAWTIPAWTIDTWYNSPSIVSALQEIVNRGSWASDNAMAFMIMDDGSSTDAARVAVSYDTAFTTTRSPILNVVYTP